MDHFDTAAIRIQPVTHQAKKFTKNERRFFEAIKAVPKETAIGCCIHNTLESASRTDMRQLISELKDQLRDAPENTTIVLGVEAIEILKQL